MKNRHQRTVTAFAVVAFLLGSGCSKSAEDCSYTASCGNSEKSDSGNTGSCTPACSGATPVCKESTAKCVECTKNSDCAGSGKPTCDTTADECIQCRSNADCTSAAASVCIAGTCTGCTDNSGCNSISGKPVCEVAVSPTGAIGQGTCVTCTPANESACGGNSCNPATKTCTNTRIGSVGTCHACVADSECTSGSLLTARCVSMNYRGSPHGSYCLQRADVVTCAQPYTVAFSSPSLSAARSAPNCGIDQATTTCEAVLSLVTPTTCTRSNTCGAGLGDGQCQNLSVGGMRCTIPCTAATQCVTGQTCSGAVNGYCR
jgi:hypothetical protein